MRELLPSRIHHERQPAGQHFFSLCAEVNKTRRPSSAPPPGNRWRATRPDGLERTSGIRARLSGTQKRAERPPSGARPGFDPRPDCSAPSMRLPLSGRSVFPPSCACPNPAAAAARPDSSGALPALPLPAFDPLDQQRPASCAGTRCGGNSLLRLEPVCLELRKKA